MVCIFLSTISSSNYYEAFKEEDVKPLDAATDFSGAKKDQVSEVQGNGQTVRWKGSNVTVYVKNAEGIEVATQLRRHKEGELTLSKGMRLWITEGKYTES
jgi:hypothetical protein